MTSMVRWILFLVAAFLGAVFVVANWHGLLAWLIKRRGTSAVPVIGGAFLALAMAIAPGPSARSLWWLPLVLDPGCLLLLVTSGFFWLRGGYDSKDRSRPPGRAG
jgi:hypothetical protein